MSNLIKEGKRHSRCELDEEQEKSAASGFNEVGDYGDENKTARIEPNRELHEMYETGKSVKTNALGVKKMMETSKKSDGVLTADAFRVKALLIRSNFL